MTTPQTSKAVVSVIANGGYCWFSGIEHELAMALREAFDGQFAIDDSNDDAAITWSEGTVHNQDIPGVNAGFTHGLPGHSDKEGCRWVLDEVLIEVQGAIEVIIGWRRIAG